MASIRGRLALVWLAIGLLAAGWGCSAKVPDRVPAPAIDPAGSAAKAMAMYDTNHDGVISGDELNKCPAIKNALKQFSTGDGKVTAETITAELQNIKDSKVGIMSVVVHVKLDGADLDGATVLFDPEPFMAGSIAQAHGVTNAHGSASIAIDPQDRNTRGVNPGLYKVRITKQVNGKEIIPARYNSEKDTQLGVEVAQSNLEMPNQMHFDLTSR